MTDPILISVAGTLAGKAATELYELVKRRFRRHPERAAALAAAVRDSAGSAEVVTLAEALAVTEREDPDFGRQLRAALPQLEVRNVVSGTVTGTVVQIGGDVTGGIQLR
jgi:hypothetical protein